jgi:hypothetical protein
VSIKNFKFNDRSKTKTLKGMEVFSANYITIFDICNHLSVPVTDIVLAKRPVFEGISNMKVRCLIAVGIGCDTYINGVPGITAKVIHDFIMKLKQEKKPISDYYGSNMDKYLKHYTLDVKKKSPLLVGLPGQDEINKYSLMVNTFVDSMIYEPTNVTNGSNINMNLFVTNQYMDADFAPTSLHPYLQSFARNDTTIEITGTIDQCDDLSVCIGPGNGPHVYMGMEGNHTCFECQKIICKTCTFPNGDEMFCVNCFAASNFITVSELDSSITTEEMAQQLTQRGYQVLSNDPVEDIIDMFDTIINKNNGIYCEEVFQNVTVPKEIPMYLQSLQPIITFDLKKGASFIDDDSLNLQEVIDVLQIIQELVNIKKHNHEKDDMQRTYSVIPTLLIDIANHARHEHAGYRLLKRCIRHALDSASVDIQLAKVSVVKVDYETALLVEHKVRASMKQELYDVTVCFTKQTVIACSCTCKCGGQGTEKVLCIQHVLPVMYQMLLLVFEGLAEHILVE